MKKKTENTSGVLIIQGENRVITLAVNGFTDWPWMHISLVVFTIFDRQGNIFIHWFIGCIYKFLIGKEIFSFTEQFFYLLFILVIFNVCR